MKKLFLLFFLFGISLFAQDPILPPFDLEKVKQVFDNYQTHHHAGVTVVMGHPFEDRDFREGILQEQRALLSFFETHQKEDLLYLYDIDQVHATLIELAQEHFPLSAKHPVLNEKELTISSKTKMPMEIDYLLTWLQNTSAFEVEVGPDVLSEAHKNQTLRITDSGQIVMKGRAIPRNLLSIFRGEFEKEAGIIHKYTSQDDEFFFVIGYLKPNPRLQDVTFRENLGELLEKHRKEIHLQLKIDHVRVILYNSYSLDFKACLWESPNLYFKKAPDLPLKTLLKTLQDVCNQLEASYFEKAM